MSKAALIYTRVSQDRAQGRSPEEQQAEAEAFCRQQEWNVVGVITDSVGASRRSKGHRHGWDEVLERIASGTVDVLVTWEASRRTRDLEDFVELRKRCRKHGVLLANSGQVFDPNVTNDTFMLTLATALAERETDENSDRIRRAMRANATSGRPHGRRLFGYRRLRDAEGRSIGQEPDPAESAVVRQIFSDYLSGQGIRTVAKALRTAGITTGTGATWTDSQIRRVLVNPGYVARRVHQGEVVGAATWPALVSDDDFERVQARLEAMNTGRTRQTRTARLLTGVGRCGVCGGKLHAGHDRNQRKVYSCRDKHCVARDMRKLDAYVTAVVIERLSNPDVPAALSSTPADPRVDNARVLLGELYAQRTEARQGYADRQIPMSALAEIESYLQPQIDAAERSIRTALVPIDTELPTGDVQGWWDDLTGEVQRSVVAAFISAVIVNPTKRGSRNFDPAAVEIEWRR